MAVPEDAVTWGAFWKLMGLFGTIGGAAFTLLLKQIGVKANADVVEANRQNIQHMIGRLATFDQLNGHFEDDNHRFEALKEQIAASERNIIAAVKNGRR